MPYGRYPRRPRRRASSRPITYSQIGSKVVRDVANLKRLLNVEVKFIDTSVAGVMATAAAATASTHVSPIAQGDGDSSRDGNSVKAVSVHYRSAIRFNTSSTTPSLVRTILVQSSYGEGYTPTLDDILTDGTDVNSFQQINKSRGFKILYDNISTFDNEHELKYLKFNKSLSHHLKWDGTAAAEHTFGQLWEFVVTSEVTNRPSFASECRLRYVDN